MKNFWIDKKKKKPESFMGLGGTMGLGVLGSPTVRFIRKWRFTIEFRQDEKIIVDPCFVKIKDRTHCPVGPGELSFTQYGDSTSQPKSIINFIALAYDNVVENITAALKLYDGCGFQLEQWNLSGISLIKANFGDLDYSNSDECEINIDMAYKECIYENMMPSFNPL